MNEEKQETKHQDAKAPAKKTPKTAKIAAVRIRGLCKRGKQREYTLKMLKLHRKHACVIIDNTPSNMGMINKVKNIVTWGEIDDSTLKELTSKRGKKTKKEGKEILKPFFSLHPPKGGFERKGTKMQFSLGGALGYRGEKINDLIRRML